MSIARLSIKVSMTLVRISVIPPTDMPPMDILSIGKQTLELYIMPVL